MLIVKEIGKHNVFFNGSAKEKHRTPPKTTFSGTSSNCRAVRGGGGGGRRRGPLMKAMSGVRLFSFYRASERARSFAVTGGQMSGVRLFVPRAEISSPERPHQ